MLHKYLSYFVQHDVKRLFIHREMLLLVNLLRNEHDFKNVVSV